MMNISSCRVMAMVRRHLFLAFREIRAITQDVYWPVLDIVMWGFTGIFLSKNATLDTTMLLATLLICVSFWQIFLRSSLEVSVSMLEELWTGAIFTQFATPLSATEWALATVILGAIRTVTTVFIGAVALWYLFSISIFKLGFMLVPAAFFLFVFGIAIGFFTAGLLIFWGKKNDSLAWMIGWSLAPFSTIYYPIDVLPTWMQSVSRAMPMHYVFEAMGAAIRQEGILWRNLGKALFLDIIYLIGSFLFFLWMFKKSRARGFSRLM